jgi:hypothetical protein
MPTSYDPQPLRIEFYCRDESGKVSSGSVRLPYGTTFATARSFALELARAAERVTDGQIEGVGISLTMEFEDSAAAQVGSDVERCGVFIYESLVADDRYLLQLPSVRTTMLESLGQWAGIGIDQVAPAIVALVNLLITGDGTVAPISLDGNDLVTLNAAYLQYRKP